MISLMSQSTKVDLEARAGVVFFIAGEETGVFLEIEAFVFVCELL
jgi:hypothetical protein